MQYLLAGNQNAVGLGEVRQLADGRGWKNEAGDCSCGQAVQFCPVWQGLQPNPNDSKLEWYKRLLEKSQALYPQATHLVDSSKSIHTVQPWIDLGGEGLVSNVYIIYIVRDARGWAVSDENTRKRKNRPSRPIVMSMLAWWKNQLRTIRYINNDLKRMDPLFVSYESLVFQADTQLLRINEFCSLESEGKDIEEVLCTSNVHDVFGNRMKNDTSKRTKLVYDDRWQYRMSANLWLPLLYPIWKLNSKLRRQGGA
ncbi:sulfotransferase domain-containing protein [Desulfonatronovibrio hydrogenovorans]|uniref:sulfotransferase domain-containing protein n=1 Tax=Desulfonatronovibrio hydrogenovorans TaxID=53245 RepID=UPI0004917774|nr:sulfotransferase domain-containing protein [Desulfonatronovibrio hydrogenovorans]